MSGEAHKFIIAVCRQKFVEGGAPGLRQMNESGLILPESIVVTVNAETSISEAGAIIRKKSSVERVK